MILFFFWVNNRRACAWVRLKNMRVSTLGPLPLWTFLSKARLVFSISRHSSSNQGLHFLGIVVALGMLSFAASLTWATNEVRGSWSHRMSSVILSIHNSANCSQSAFENTQWLGCSVPVYLQWVHRSLFGNLIFITRYLRVLYSGSLTWRAVFMQL